MDGAIAEIPAVGLSPPTRGNQLAIEESARRGRSIPAHAGEPRRRSPRTLPSAVYPRPRGGTGYIERDRNKLAGLSPPTRGNPPYPRLLNRNRRSIPAHAGEPRRRDKSERAHQVYPRPRGGTANSDPRNSACGGLSPPTRGEPFRCGRRARRRRVYPRPRGGTDTDGQKSGGDAGLSPPTRGNRDCRHYYSSMTGSIPAHAGEPYTSMSSASVCAVYPRPRGGTLGASGGRLHLRGLSPPTRGNLCVRQADNVSGRSIPAHAGEPQPVHDDPARTTVYPRPRGGTFAAAGFIEPTPGLSPPTRGNRKSRNLSCRARGSIPAHAGEPAVQLAKFALREVYPRPRGGTESLVVREHGSEGLSPPTRGNLVDGFRNGTIDGSIPAHAGEPTPQRERAARLEVYPRPRGGTGHTVFGHNAAGGLSPPTRGNLPVRVEARRPPRSIPAHAGEPTVDTALTNRYGVYPRPRGGTSMRTQKPIAAGGLSPPTRGNPREYHSPAPSSGSIPAHAGEPCRRPPRIRAGTVYPRPRGGTEMGAPSLSAADGLSPPTRGNLPPAASSPCAEPVYPRPRGGTAKSARLPRRAVGLSPPTRGNRRRGAWANRRRRSIPAHAGEPRDCGIRARRSRVYPRPRGGTVTLRASRAAPSGLSPPTRGNPVRVPYRPATRRSIPAHAGEPSRSPPVLARSGVYPRPRGGTRGGRDFAPT